MRTLTHAVVAPATFVFVVALSGTALAQGSTEPPPAADPDAPAAPPGAPPPESAPAAPQPQPAPAPQPGNPPGVQPHYPPQPQYPPGSQPPPPGWGQPPPGYGPPYAPPGYGQQPAYPPYYYPYYYPQHPGPAIPERPKKERNSPAAIVIGITMMSVGVVGLVAGGAVFGSASDAVDVYCDPGPEGGGVPFQCDRRDHEGRQVAGVVLMVSGGIVAAAGIPILIVGARKVPARDNGATPTPSQPEAPPPAPAAATFSLSVNPTGAVLGGSF